jgi:hypothetical protein
MFYILGNDINMEPKNDVNNQNESSKYYFPLQLIDKYIYF